MRILFFYCKDIRREGCSSRARSNVREALDGLQMNFDAEWRFSYDGVGVCTVAHEYSLPPKFFSYDDSGRVNISSVVGENGCGKTSLARMFHLLSLSAKGLRLLIVAEDQDVFYVWGSSVTVNFVAESLSDKMAVSCAKTLNERKGKRIRSEGIGKVLKFVYFSPVYTSQHVMDRGRHRQFNSLNSFFVDVSTTGLLRHGGLSRQGDWQDFEYQDARRIWEFLRSVAIRRKESARSCLYLPGLIGMKISVNRDLMTSAIDGIRHLAEEFRNRDGVVARAEADTVRAKFVQRAAHVAEGLRSCSLLCAYALYSAALTSWHKRIVEEDEDPTGEDLGMLEMLEDIKASATHNTPRAVCKVREQLLKFAVKTEGDIEKTGKRTQLLKLFDALVAFYGPKLSGVKDGLNVILSDQTRFDTFLKVFDAHKMLRMDEDFLSFEPNPKMSSGEWALLTMFARIYAKRGEFREKGVVLFLDEAETALHPNWQRRLVADLIRFCEMFLQTSRIHIILATHSPLLLSDLPKGNVVYIRKRDGIKDGFPLRIVVDEDLPNTFGANIYDLYRDSFFMKDGPIGEHARIVIRRLLRAIADRVPEVLVDGGRPEKDSGEYDNMAKDGWLDVVGDELLIKYIERLRSFGLLPERK